MPDNKKAIKRVYDAGMAEVFKVVSSLDATQAQVRVAKKTSKDLTAMLVAHTLETVAGRTGLLSGLIVELGEVIDTMKTKSPYAGALDKFNGLVTRAKTLFAEEKSALS